MVRIMDYRFPVDSSSLSSNEDDRLLYYPFRELFKIKTVTKFSCNKSTDVYTVDLEDADPLETVVE